MRILICEAQFSAGGAERVVCNLANYLSKKNVVKVVALARSEVAYEMSKEVTFDFIDTRVYQTNRGKLSKMYNKLKKNIFRLFRLSKEIKTFEPDIILSFLPEPSFFTLFLKKKDVPVIISVRNDPKIEYRSKVYHFLMKWLYPKADGIVFQTEEAKEYFNDIISCSVKVIPNPINPEFIKKPFSGNRKKKIVSVGRLAAQKNQKMLIEAFTNLSSKFKNYTLTIYGEGELRESLLKEIQEKQLEKRVFLPGVEKDIKNKIYDASLFVLTSAYEGMPNALMEAMALGLPVISTDCPCGGPAFLIKNNINGILVQVNDVEGLTKSIERILSDPVFSKKIALNASRISQTLSPEKINKEWADFIDQIMTEMR